MATKYFTEGRVRMLRLHAGFLRCHDIVKEFVEITLSEALGIPRTDFQTLTWPRWCHENIAFIRRYHFWRNQAKEEDEGEEIPVFDEVDITFCSYLMRAIAPNCPGEVLYIRSFNYNTEPTDRQTGGSLETSDTSSISKEM